MKKHLALLSFVLLCGVSFGQNYMTPQKLIELNRVSGMGITKDGKVVYAVSKVDVASNKRSTKFYTMSLDGSQVEEVKSTDGLLADKNVSPDGAHKITIEDVKIRDVFGTDFYPEMKQSNMMIYNELNYRHWDKWEDGKYNHVMVSNADGSNKMDIMANEPFDCPQQPFGGDEDYIWAPRRKKFALRNKEITRN